jgi:hypothetical protein
MAQQIDVPGMGIVEFPDGMSDADITAAIQRNLPKQEPSGSVTGAAKSLGVGLAEGVTGLAGLPGDLYHMGLRALGDNLTPESRFGSNAIKKSVEGVTGEFYKPQGAIEETFNKVGQFAPAVLGGPEALATRVATRAAIPAVASEIGGKVAGPYGELGGALLGAGGATAATRKFQEMAAARNGASALPSGEKLIETGSNQFNQARSMDVVVKPDFAQKAAADMRAALKDFDPEDAAVKDVFRKIDRLDNLAPPTSSIPVAVEMNEIENVRKQLSKLRMSPDASTREAAKKAQEVLTKNQMAITSGDVIAGDAPLYSKTMQEAVGNYGAGKRSAVVTGKQELAELNAGTAGSGANEDNALRQAMKQLARPINNTDVPVAKRLGFNDPEIAAIKGAATGTAAGNTARYLGKLAPTGSVSGALGGGAGYALGGPVGAIGLPAAGYLAKKIGDLSTKRAVAAVDSLVRSRSPLAAQVASQLPPQVIQQLPAKTQRLLQGLILADPILANQPRQAIGQPAT